MEEIDINDICSIDKKSREDLLTVPLKSKILNKNIPKDKKLWMNSPEKKSRILT